jgi:hypothetical protein
MNSKPAKGIKSLDLLIDKNGFFIPFCNYEKHRGVIRDPNYIVCEERGCVHYIKFRGNQNERSSN